MRTGFEPAARFCSPSSRRWTGEPAWSPARPATRPLTGLRRVAAVLENWEDAEFLASLGEEPVMLRLIELHLRMNQPNLALAWCTIAAAEGWPADQVHPLLHRAWQTLSREG